MLCQLCQKRTANVHFTQVINNKKAEMYLCEQCANERGQPGLSPLLNINGLLSGFIGFGNNDSFVAPGPKEIRCEICGMSYEDFKKTGKLGCGNCYRIYGERLKPVLKRLHGNTGHIGKVPLKVSENMRVSKEIDALKGMLAKAVQNEEYEKAAEIRDRIKLMEGGH